MVHNHYTAEQIHWFVRNYWQYGKETFCAKFRESFNDASFNMKSYKWLKNRYGMNAIWGMVVNWPPYNNAKPGSHGTAGYVPASVPALPPPHTVRHDFNSRDIASESPAGSGLASAAGPNRPLGIPPPIGTPGAPGHALGIPAPIMGNIPGQLAPPAAPISVSSGSIDSPAAVPTPLQPMVPQLAPRPANMMAAGPNNPYMAAAFARRPAAVAVRVDKKRATAPPAAEPGAKRHGGWGFEGAPMPVVGGIQGPLAWAAGPSNNTAFGKAAKKNAFPPNLDFGPAAGASVAGPSNNSAFGLNLGFGPLAGTPAAVETPKAAGNVDEAPKALDKGKGADSSIDPSLAGFGDADPAEPVSDEFLALMKEMVNDEETVAAENDIDDDNNDRWFNSDAFLFPDAAGAAPPEAAPALADEPQPEHDIAAAGPASPPAPAVEPVAEGPSSPPAEPHRPHPALAGFAANAVPAVHAAANMAFPAWQPPQLGTCDPRIFGYTPDEMHWANFWGCCWGGPHDSCRLVGIHVHDQTNGVHFASLESALGSGVEVVSEGEGDAEEAS